MGDVSWSKGPGAFSDFEDLITAVEGHFSFQDVPGLVFGVMNVAWDGIAGWGDLIDECEAPLGLLAVCLEEHERSGEPDRFAFFGTCYVGSVH
jgi:hypothetical protein